MVRTDTAPSSRTRSTTCCTSTSGADAPAVMPMLRLPCSHAGSMACAPSIR